VKRLVGWWEEICTLEIRASFMSSSLVLYVIDHWYLQTGSRPCISHVQTCYQVRLLANAGTSFRTTWSRFEGSQGAVTRLGNRILRLLGGDRQFGGVLWAQLIEKHGKSAVAYGCFEETDVMFHFLQGWMRWCTPSTQDSHVRFQEDNDVWFQELRE